VSLSHIIKLTRFSRVGKHMYCSSHLKLPQLQSTRSNRSVKARNIDKSSQSVILIPTLTPSRLFLRMGRCAMEIKVTDRHPVASAAHKAWELHLHSNRDMFQMVDTAAEEDFTTVVVCQMLVDTIVVAISSR